MDSPLSAYSPFVTFVIGDHITKITLRLSRYFGNTPQFWLGLQADYDIDVTRKTLGRRILREVKI
jgi:plasmid maintenance system antidote protein VapI